MGLYSSGSAVIDLKTELASMYGTEYTGKITEYGTEDMIFVVEPKTWFLTNWNLRNVLGMSYKYECQVIFITYIDEKIYSVRTVTYQATDPMGTKNMTERAFIDLGSSVERVEIK